MKTHNFLLGAVVASSLGLAACGGGGGSSSSGGGSELNLTGTWRILPHSNSTVVIFRPGVAILQQSGNSVTSSSIEFEAQTIPCDTSESKMNGVVSGNTFNGSITSALSSTSFSMTGTSDSLSGDFTITYNSGICRGTYNGTAAMTKI